MDTLEFNSPADDDAYYRELWKRIMAAEVVAMALRTMRGQNNQCVFLRPFPGVSHDVKLCLAKLGSAFAKLNTTGTVHFSEDDQLVVGGHLWRYLYKPSNVDDTIIERVIHHASELASLLAESNYQLLSPLDECFDLAEEQRILRELAEFASDLLPPASTKKRGARPKQGRVDLVCKLAAVYRNAGGRVSASWTSDGSTLSGDFPAFLAVIWGILPAHARPPTALTFMRLARKVPRELRGQEIRA
jgi:hypothetical protein